MNRVEPPEYEWHVEGNYGYGWDHLTTEFTESDAMATAELYDREEPGIPHRVRRYRWTPDE